MAYAEIINPFNLYRTILQYTRINHFLNIVSNSPNRYQIDVVSGLTDRNRILYPKLIISAIKICTAV